MALILHLSDLHLGMHGSAQDIDDHKIALVPPEERVRRRDALRSTLLALGRHLEEGGRRLDAVAVTGDTTVANDDTGFDHLRALLAALGNALPSDNAIAVIPGNHDVMWNTAPSTTERYRHFLAGTRPHGYTTPLLDGTDLGGEQPDPDRHAVVLDGGRILIIPMNSANYSGALAEVPGLSEDDLARLLANVVDRGHRDRLTTTIQQLRLHDVARVSPNQLEALDDLLRSLEKTDRIARTTVKIALIHHHLLPVSTREEFKTFESLTNLGLVREFLRSHDFAVVLHGHKHESRLYWDYIPEPPSTSGGRPVHPVFVVSGSTLGGVDYSREEVARLIEVDAATTAPVISVTPLPAVNPGHPLPPSRRTIPVGLPASPDCPEFETRPTLIYGRDFDTTYDGIVRAMVLADGPIHTLVATVARLPSEPVSLPTSYPKIPDRADEEREAWLKEMVRWWQRSTTHLGTFTHGARIRAFGGQQIDQLKMVMEELSRKPSTSRESFSSSIPRLMTIGSIRLFASLSSALPTGSPAAEPSMCRRTTDARRCGTGGLSTSPSSTP